MSSHSHLLRHSYYHTDLDVQNDSEIQAFANEISSEGTGKDGGRGKVNELKFFATEYRINVIFYLQGISTHQSETRCLLCSTVLCFDYICIYNYIYNYII